MSTKREKEKTSSPDYPLLARNLFETSGEPGISKLPAGLYVVATPIGHLGDISLRALWTLAQADRIACEDTRNSGNMLNKYGIKKPLLPYHDHNADVQRPKILEWITAGEAIALISDAGLPLIADPGYKLVRDCRKASLAVSVIPGANAGLTALAGSGLPTDRFFFAGFLPPKSTARKKAIGELKNIPATLILYEAPQRLAATLQDLAEIFGGERLAVVARELTKFFEESRQNTLAELADFYASNEAKGEVTLIIAPPETSQASSCDIDQLLMDSLKTMSVRDATAAVSDITGVKKSEVYAMALKLTNRQKH